MPGDMKMTSLLTHTYSFFKQEDARSLIENIFINEKPHSSPLSKDLRLQICEEAGVKQKSFDLRYASSFDWSYELLERVGYGDYSIIWRTRDRYGAGLIVANNEQMKKGGATRRFVNNQKVAPRIVHLCSRETSQDILLPETFIAHKESKKRHQ